MAFHPQILSLCLCIPATPYGARLGASDLAALSLTFDENATVRCAEAVRIRVGGIIARVRAHSATHQAVWPTRTAQA